MKLYRNVITQKNTDKILITINQHENNESREVTKMKRFHYIHIIDRSGSMAGDIDELITDVNATFKLMKDGDIVSVIWFSSANLAGWIIQEESYSERLSKLMDNFRSVLGATCFSNPLSMVLERLTNYVKDDRTTVVNLFTDGQAVVNWGVDEEQNRCYEIAEKLKDRVVAINTVGYGQYYDQNFLKMLAAQSQYGRFVHASQIREYSDIFETSLSILKENVLQKIDVRGKWETAIYLSRKVVRDFKGNKISLGSLDTEKNQFFILLPEDGTLEINGETIETSQINRGVNPITIMNFMYSYAYVKYNDGDRATALDIESNEIKNKYLVDRHLAAMTFNEVANFTKVLLERVLSPVLRRNDPVCPDGYVPSENAFCLLDLFFFLAEDDAEWLLFHPKSNSYRRIGKQSSSSGNQFNSDDLRNIGGSFRNLIFNKSRMNIGVQFVIPGFVETLPEDYERFGKRIKTFQYRTFNIINDGYPNMTSIVARMSQDEFRKRSKVVDMNIIDRDEENGKVIAEIDLLSIPVINRSYATTDTEEILKNHLKILFAETQVKVMKYLIDQKKQDISPQTSEFQSFLEKYNIKSDGSYNPPEVSRPKNEDCDFYIAKHVEFQLQGTSSIPSMNEYFKRINELKDPKKKVKGTGMNYGMSLIDKYLEAMNNIVSETQPNSQLQRLEEMMKQVKLDLQNMKRLMTGFKMGTFLTGSWYQGVITEKDKFIFESKKEKDKVLVIKVNDEKVYF